MTNAKVKNPNERDIIYIGSLNGPDEVIQIRALSDFYTWLHQNRPLIRQFDEPTSRSCHLTTIRVNGVEPMTSGHVAEID